MKKIIALLMTLAMMLSFAATGVYAAVGCGDRYCKGDVDGDGEINTTDYLLVKIYFLNGGGMTAKSLGAADIDNNYVIDGTDYLFIKRHFLKIAEIPSEGYYKGADISAYSCDGTKCDADEVKKVYAAYQETLRPGAGITADDVNIGACFGPFGDACVMFISCYDEAFIAAITYENVAGEEFAYSSGQHLKVYSDGALLSLSEAFEKGALSKTDIEILSKVYYNRFPYLIDCRSAKE